MTRRTKSTLALSLVAVAALAIGTTTSAAARQAAAGEGNVLYRTVKVGDLGSTQSAEIPCRGRRQQG